MARNDTNNIFKNYPDALTLGEFAEMLGISQNTYSQYEIGVLNYPVDVIIKLADFYGTTTDYLLGRTDKK